MAWKFRPRTELELANDQLRTEIVQLRHQLSTKEQFVDRLQFLLRRRTETIDELAGKLQQARAANQKLDAECEHYAAKLAKG
jgi:hypothetical protein